MNFCLLFSTIPVVIIAMKAPPSQRQEDAMFARAGFPIARAPFGDDMLAEMAHAMGCATLIQPDRTAPPAHACAGRPVLMGRRRIARPGPAPVPR
jgi:hypothetical protein